LPSGTRVEYWRVTVITPLAGSSLGALITTSDSTYVAVEIEVVVYVAVVLVCVDGAVVGSVVGSEVGSEVGAVVGSDGNAVGVVVGDPVGDTEGDCVGVVDGLAVGDAVGAEVGESVAGIVKVTVFFTICVLGALVPQVYMNKRGLVMVPQFTPTVLNSSVAVPLLEISALTVSKSVEPPPTKGVPRR
jgi:hypothetical protein